MIFFFKQKFFLSCNVSDFTIIYFLEADEVTVVVRNCATGEILRGNDAPKMEEIDEWMERNPGYEIISRDAVSDSEDEKSDDERPKEPVVESKEEELEGFLKNFLLLFFSKILICRIGRGAAQSSDY